MAVDDDRPGELKIKGQAEAMKRKGKWDDDDEVSRQSSPYL